MKIKYQIKDILNEIVHKNRKKYRIKFSKISNININ